jgi:hypothetical protein
MVFYILFQFYFRNDTDIFTIFLNNYPERVFTFGSTANIKSTYFSSTPEAYPSEASFGCSTLAQVPTNIIPVATVIKLFAALSYGFS